MDDPPGAYGGGGLVTHRIIAIDESGQASGAEDQGRRERGAATRGGSGSRVREQARAVAGVPYVGYAFGALAIREIRIALIGVPALLIALALLAGLWRGGRRGEPRSNTRPRAAGSPNRRGS